MTRVLAFDWKHPCDNQIYCIL